MNRILEFVKVGGVWFYWWPDYVGDPYALSMIEGADLMLDSLGTKLVRLHMVDATVAKIKLTLLECDADGATYLCNSKNYNGRVWLCPVTLEVFGEYPQAIYLSEL